MKVAVNLTMYVDVPTKDLDKALDRVKYAIAAGMRVKGGIYARPKRPPLLLRFGGYTVSTLDENGKPLMRGMK